MSNMNVEDISDELVTIYFDNDDVMDQFNKSYLMEHSAYFNAMFHGNFIETQTGFINLKFISHASFMGVINSLKHNNVLYDDLKSLLLVLETSQLLQFSLISFKSLRIVKQKYLYTINAVDVYLVLSKLGLKVPLQKAYIYILYNFQKLLIQKKESLLRLDEDDLKLLLSNNNLNVDEEIDVYNLIIDWCSKNDYYTNEYALIVGCVHFDSMTNEQLQCCISKTNNEVLINIINDYITCSKEHPETRLLKSFRSVPYFLCAVKNEMNGQVFIYRWDWNCKQFTKFLKLQPLPIGINGYHLFVKDFEIYIMAGEVGYGRGLWNEEGWKYNLLTKKWKKLEGFIPSKRRHGIGHFCGDDFYLIGGHTKHRLTNELIEKFRLDTSTDTLVCVKSSMCPNSSMCTATDNRMFKRRYTFFEHNGHLAMITRDNKPTWLKLLYPENTYSKEFYWESRLIELNAIVICANSHRGSVYILTRNLENTIVLYSYCPTSGVCHELKTFSVLYQSGTTMCAFNIGKVLVIGPCVVEHYFIDDDVFIKYKTAMNSFHSNHFISVPAY